jgi:dihydroorotase
MSAVVITGADIVGSGVRDIALSRGVFVDPEEIAGLKGTRVVDASGLVALPGLVDLHTHLRQPGGEQAETIESGSRAAALGGYTAVHAMANTHPVADTAEAVTRVWQWGQSAGLVDVRPVGAVTKRLAGTELSAMKDMANSPARVRVFSDDGKCVHDEDVMRKALSVAHELGAVVAQHAQDPHRTVGAQMNEGALAATLGLEGWPAVAEESIIARDAELAESLGARLHICHVSTAGSVEVIAWAKKRGIGITAEVTPHHLLLTEDLVASFDPLYKVNPPLRTQEDIVALREGLRSGVIDIVATDHAPHPAELKDCSFSEGAFGMLGLESALPVVNTTLVATGMLSWEDVARVMSVSPATIGQVEGYAEPFAMGQPGHVTLIDPSASTPVPHGSLSRNNPYRHTTLHGAVVHTFYRGAQTVSHGVVASDQERTP